MKICFYNLFQIGDIYFSSFFVKKICDSNKEINFYYYFKNGDIYYKNIDNIKRINKIDEKYFENHISGTSVTEHLVHSDLYRLLKDDQCSDSRIININNEEILFINIHCRSKYVYYEEYDILSALNSYKDFIEKLNNEFNLTLKFTIENLTELLNDISYDNMYLEKYINNEFSETILIFNYIPTSCNNYNMNILNDYIKELSKTQKIILTCYNGMFDNNENIQFIDKDFNIIPVPSCSNLLEIWEIAVKCYKIIIIPSGCSWTFLHKLNEIKQDQIYYINYQDEFNIFQDILNNSINALLGENKNLIKCIS